MHAKSSSQADALDDLALIRAISQTANWSESASALLRAVEARFDSPAAIVRQGEGEPQATLVAAGTQAAAVLASAAGGEVGHRRPEPGPDANTVWMTMGPDGVRSWALPIAQLPDLHLTIMAPTATEAVILAQIDRLQTSLDRLTPVLVKTLACADATRQHRVLLHVLQLCEGLADSSAGSLTQLTDLILDMGASTAWLWYLAPDGQWQAGAVSGEIPTTDIGALLGALPDHDARGAFMDIATGAVLQPLLPLAEVSAYVGVAFPPAWREAQCAELLTSVNALFDRPWLARHVQTLVSRASGAAPLVAHAERVSAEISRVVDHFGEDRIEALKGLTQTAAKMTHEVRNKLNVVATGAYLLKMKTGSQMGDGAQRLFQQIEENIQASSNLMSEMLQAYRKWPK